jgi:lysozyme
MKMLNLKILQDFEGLRLEAYQDTGGVWTIGYGHTGPEVKQGMTISKEKALEYFINDIKWAEEAVNKNLAGYELTQNQFDALVSLTYNIGTNGFARSTTVKRIKEGDYIGAAEAITWWNKVNGNIVQGLVNRRKKEKALFLEPDQPDLPFPDNSVRDAKVKVLVDKFIKDYTKVIENGK